MGVKKSDGCKNLKATACEAAGSQEALLARRLPLSDLAFRHGVRLYLQPVVLGLQAERGACRSHL